MAMSEDGLVLGEGSRLARMSGGGKGGLALDADRDRVLALLAITYGRPVNADILVHAEAASAHWQRGDKALANLRLVFAGLPRLDNPTDAARLRLAEYCLDEGLSPHVLLKELGLDPTRCGLAKYNPDEPRDAWGRWTDATAAAPSHRPRRDGTIAVAAATIPEDPIDDAKRPSATEEPGSGPGHVSPLEITTHDPTILAPVPSPVGGASVAPRAPFATDVSAIAKEAAAAAGPGRGPVYGTRVHTEFRDRIRALEDPNLRSEQSYLNGKPVRYGSEGSVRLDGVAHSDGAPAAIYDLKTGGASLTKSRELEIRSHLPEGYKNIPVIEVRP